MNIVTASISGALAPRISAGAANGVQFRSRVSASVAPARVCAIGSIGRH